jgi:hypothetical protein
VRSIGADPSNAASINGIYLPRAAMVLGQMFDVERVEVLKARRARSMAATPPAARST